MYTRPVPTNRRRDSNRPGPNQPPHKNSPTSNHKQNKTAGSSRPAGPMTPTIVVNSEVVSEKSDDERLAEYRIAFTFFDANRDGRITADELESAMNKCGVHPTKLELHMIMLEGDKDQNGVITFDEFVQMIHQQQEFHSDRVKEVQKQKQQRHRALAASQPSSSSSASSATAADAAMDDESLWRIFRMFDKNHDGFIGRSEMSALVRELSLGKEFPAHVIDRMFYEADADGDGRISFAEFVMSVR